MDTHLASLQGVGGRIRIWIAGNDLQIEMENIACENGNLSVFSAARRHTSKQMLRYLLEDIERELAGSEKHEKK